MISLVDKSRDFNTWECARKLGKVAQLEQNINI